MKEVKKQQALNELSQRLAQPIQQITQLFRPVAKQIELVGDNLYAAKNEIERRLDELSLDDCLVLSQLRQAGGRKRAVQRKQEAKEQSEKVIAKWHSLEATPERYRVGIIAGMEGYPSESTVRRILRDAGLIKKAATSLSM